MHKGHLVPYLNIAIETESTVAIDKARKYAANVCKSIAEAMAADRERQRPAGIHRSRQ
jgi:hypothetical protein